MDLLKIIFIIALFLIPFGEVARLQFNNGISLTANDLGVALLISIWAVLAIKKKKKIMVPFKKPILIFIVICFLSLLINIRFLTSQEFIISFLYLLRWIIYAGIFFVVVNFDSNFKKKIQYFLIFIGAVTALIGYFQYFFYPALRNLLYLGWDEHLYRMFSSFLDPNFAGIFFVLNFLLIVGIFFTRKDWNIWPLGFLGILLLVAIFLTYSRSAMLMLAVSVFALLVILGRKKLLIGAALVLIVGTVIFSQFYKSEGTNLFRTNSSFARIGSSKDALYIFTQNPVLGVGFNAYRYAQHRYGFLKDPGWEFSHSGAGTDNSFLFVLSTTGIIGFASYIYLWFKIIRENIKNKTTISLVLIVSVLGLFVNAFFINSLFYPFIMEWMWILIGLSIENK